MRFAQKIKTEDDQAQKRYFVKVTSVDDIINKVEELKKKFSIETFSHSRYYPPSFDDCYLYIINYLCDGEFKIWIGSLYTKAYAEQHSIVSWRKLLKVLKQ